MFVNQSGRSTPVKSRILVPQRYQRQPVISRLVSRYRLTVNIKAASLVSGGESDGWFDLEIFGNPQELTSSLSYLQGLGVNLLQIAIANQIQPSSNSQHFPNLDRKLSISKLPHQPQQSSQQIQQWITGGQTSRLRVQLCILKTYHQKPIISQLVSRYGLTVNIFSASLPPDLQEDGWFDLDLWGRSEQIYSSLTYLEKMGLPLWIDWSSVYSNSLLIE
ncbi:MAG TPA: NIL domain-containing protein [Nostocaceae cyanobacterium]|nr:NIL domain-containing protein [Nostocaceae cyanobacterium]